ncbi:MAG: BlaI/MecI/CopY family transcriptional regulator, partial [Lachnospiraceae bacterium]|nr:BlaI/MecI/CopY family transcriptional regulator [Lachnospiraceae bacterium]
MQLSNNEYLIMQLLWKADAPLSRADILKGTTGRNWNPASIHLILNSMLSKGVIKITDEEKKYARTYEATLSQDEYMLSYIDDGMPDKSDVEKLEGVLAAMISRKGIKAAELEKLEAVIAK